MTTDTTVGAAPGRLGDPSLTIGTDPRADPRMVAVFTTLGIDGHADGAPLGPDAPREQLLGFVEAVEGGFEGLFAALAQDAPPVEGVRDELVTITAEGGHEIRLHVHRPDLAALGLPPPLELGAYGVAVRMPAKSAAASVRKCVTKAFEAGVGDGAVEGSF